MEFATSNTRLLIASVVPLHVLDELCMRSVNVVSYCIGSRNTERVPLLDIVLCIDRVAHQLYIILFTGERVSVM